MLCRALRCWMNRMLAAAWNKWREMYNSNQLGSQLDGKQEQMLCRALRHWMNRMLAAAWNKWHEFYLNCKTDFGRLTLFTKVCYAMCSL